MNDLRLGKDWLANFACALIANFLIMYWYFNVFKVSNKMQNTVACEHRIGTRSFALPQKNHQEEINESVKDCWLKKKGKGWSQQLATGIMFSRWLYFE